MEYPSIDAIISEINRPKDEPYLLRVNLGNGFSVISAKQRKEFRALNTLNLTRVSENKLYSIPLSSDAEFDESLEEIERNVVTIRKADISVTAKGDSGFKIELYIQGRYFSRDFNVDLRPNEQNMEKIKDDVRQASVDMEIIRAKYRYQFLQGLASSLFPSRWSTWRGDLDKYLKAIKGLENKCLEGEQVAERYIGWSAIGYVLRDFGEKLSRDSSFLYECKSLKEGFISLFTCDLTHKMRVAALFYKEFAERAEQLSKGYKTIIEADPWLRGKYNYEEIINGVREKVKPSVADLNQSPP